MPIAAPVGAALIGGAASIGGGLLASSGAKSAANAQAQAAREAQDAQERMFQQQTALQEPFRQAGMTAQSEIMHLLGLGTPLTEGGAAPTQVGTGVQPGQVDWSAYIQNQPDVAYDYSLHPDMTPEQFGMWHYQRDGARRDLTPYTAAAAPAGPAPAARGDFGALAKPFGMEQFQADPGYAFRQSEGMKALERSAAARGGLLSGSAMKGIQRFGQDLASQEYTNAFNRYQSEKAARLNPLQSLMGAGQSAANTMTSTAGQFGQASAQNAMNVGAARASGYVGSANALGSALGSVGQIASSYPLYQAQTNYLNSMAGGGGRTFGSGASYPGGPMSIAPDYLNG